MIDQKLLMKEVTSNVAAEVADGIRDLVMDSLGQHLGQTLNKTLAEGEFYRRLSDEMLVGLQKIYKEIHKASVVEPADNSSPAVQGFSIADHSQADKLFSEASRQLDEIMATTLEATENIMSKTEELFDRQQDFAELLDSLERSGADGSGKASLVRLRELNNLNYNSCTSIMEALSFQDLTGQRLKKVVDALGKIEASVFELYVSGGLLMKTSNEKKQHDFEELAEESKRTASEIKEGKGSELKGPSRDAASQGDVDDLLASLGL